MKNTKITNEKDLFFKLLNDISFTKSDKLSAHPFFNKAFVPFMVLRYLSMDSGLTEYINYINDIQSVLSKEQLYHLLVAIVPKKRRFFTYIKKSAKKEKDVKQVSEYFTISKKEAQQYLTIKKNIAKQISGEFGKFINITK